MIDARTIPDCPICRQSTCQDRTACSFRLVARRPDERRERDPIPTNSADLVLTVEQWRTKYGRVAA